MPTGLSVTSVVASVVDSLAASGFRAPSVAVIRLLASCCCLTPVRCVSKAATAFLGVSPKIVPSLSGRSVASYNPSFFRIFLTSPSGNVTVISPVSVSGCDTSGSPKDLGLVSGSRCFLALVVSLPVLGLASPTVLVTGVTGSTVS